VQLSDDNLCLLFGKPERPGFCGQFQAEPFTCGNSRDQALSLLADIEQITGAA
jgi:hypothetical protein